MRDLRSPVFLHVDGGGILINLMFGLASVRRDGQNDENRDLPVKQCGRLRAKCGKLEFARKFPNTLHVHPALAEFSKK